MKKIVGVMPLYDDEKESYWMLPGYMRMLEAEGTIPLMLPLTEDKEELDYFLGICGGFLLTGGHDVSPFVYDAQKQPWCGQCCMPRDKMESYILQKSVEADQSLLGICRGIQLMNAFFGGTLYQDLDTEYRSNIDHHMKPPYDRTAHMVDIQKGTLLSDILDSGQIGVNSYHHQAIREVSPDFEIMAVAGDGLVEAISMKAKKYVVGVQWHPEFSYWKDENSRKLVKSFVDSIG